VKDLSKDMFRDINCVGISSGASAPEYLVLEIVEWLRKHFSIEKIVEERVVKEITKFPLPMELEK
jgi:4-hydroxy-3-methylbut-2-enyl diphosphate reductase